VQEGTELVATFVEVIRRDTDEKNAEKLKEYIYKLAAKIRHFESTGDIKQEDFSPVMQHMFLFLQEMVKDKFDPAIIRTAAAEMHRHLVVILEPHVTGESIPRLNGIFDYVASSKALEKLTSDEDFQDLNECLTQQLDSVLAMDVWVTVQAELGIKKDIDVSLDAQYSSVIAAVQEFWRKNVSGNEDTLGPLCAQAFAEIDAAKNGACFHAEPSRDAQGIRVLEELTTAVRALGTFDVVVNRIKSQTNAFKQLKLDKRACDDILEAQCSVFKAHCGKGFDKRAEKSWRIMYAKLVDIFLHYTTD